MELRMMRLKISTESEILTIMIMMMPMPYYEFHDCIEPCMALAQTSPVYSRE